MKKQPQRTCMGCNQKKDKKELIRIVKNKDNEISIDKTGKKEGGKEECSYQSETQEWTKNLTVWI